MTFQNWVILASVLWKKAEWDKRESRWRQSALDSCHTPCDTFDLFIRYCQPFFQLPTAPELFGPWSIDVCLAKKKKFITSMTQTVYIWTVQTDQNAFCLVPLQFRSISISSLSPARPWPSLKFYLLLISGLANISLSLSLLQVKCQPFRSSDWSNAIPM